MISKRNLSITNSPAFVRAFYRETRAYVKLAECQFSHMLLFKDVITHYGLYFNEKKSCFAYGPVIFLGAQYGCKRAPRKCEHEGSSNCAFNLRFGNEIVDDLDITFLPMTTRQLRDIYTPTRNERRCTFRVGIGTWNSVGMSYCYSNDLVFNVSALQHVKKIFKI